VRLSARSAAAIAATSAVGLLAFAWPMLAPTGSQLLAHASDAPVVFGLLVPLLLAVALSLVADGAMGAKAVALLGVLAATAAALRTLGAGIAGLEPIWIVIVLGAYALGPGFGFVLGALCMIASALLTGGVGPWLPFQVIGAAWVGLAAGLLAGRLPRRLEVPGLAAFAALAAVGYGWLLNLWFWPTATGLPAPIAFAPGAGPAENLRHWIAFNVATSLGYDLPRALLTLVGVLLVGRRVLDSLRRTSRLAAFAATPVFAPVRPHPAPAEPAEPAPSAGGSDDGHRASTGALPTRSAPPPGRSRAGDAARPEIRPAAVGAP